GWRGGFAKSAVDESLPDAVGGFVEWLLKESGWKVTERRAARRGAADLGAARVPALPAVHVVGFRRHAPVRRGARGARDLASPGRRPVVPPARGGGEPAHGAGGRRVA